MSQEDDRRQVDKIRSRFGLALALAGSRTGASLDLGLVRMVGAGID